MIYMNRNLHDCKDEMEVGRRKRHIRFIAWSFSELPFAPDCMTESILKIVGDNSLARETTERSTAWREMVIGASVNQMDFETFSLTYTLSNDGVTRPKITDTQEQNT